MRSLCLPFSAVFLLGAAAACGEVESPGDDDDDDDDGDAMVADASPDATVDAAPPPDAAAVTGVDLLFVIDNSGSMAEEQEALTGAFVRLVNALVDAGDDGLPSLHIGIVSTDMGAGPFQISGCAGTGDSGVLQNAPRGACSPPSDAYISDVPDGNGGREVNYTGTLSEVFTCIAELGIDGCGFEQPLESMRRALDGSNAANAGFLRAESLLAVVILADEDDCSTLDTGMFDPSQNDIDDPLGPLSSFRCFEFGVVCDPDDPRTAGAKQNCVPREDSDYMFPISEYVDFLHGIHPGRLLVATIAGPETPVDVSLTQEGNPQLDPSCVSAAGEAVPGVRLEAFAAGFPGASQTAAVCGDMDAAMEAIGQAIAARF